MRDTFHGSFSSFFSLGNEREYFMLELWVLKLSLNVQAVVYHVPCILELQFGAARRRRFKQRR